MATNLLVAPCGYGKIAKNAARMYLGNGFRGAKHTVFFNPKTKRSSTVPRHAEINRFLARKICRDLSIAEIGPK